MSILDIMAKISGGVLQESMQDQIRLETMEDDATLVLKDGSLVSLIELGGAVRNPGEADIAAMADRMRNIMAPYFSVPGHALEVNFMRDSAAARRFLERQVERTKRGAHALQLDLDDVLQERVTKLSTQMVSEICLITVTTRPSVLDKEELADDLADFGKRMRGVPKMSDAQVPRKALTSAHARHAALVEALEHNLKGLGQIARALTVTESLQEIRAGLYPDTYPTKDEWFPNLPKWSNEGKRRDTVKPGGKALSMMPESPAQMMGNEFSNLGVPTFDHQLATEDSYIESTRNVRIGGMIFNSFDMTLAPEILPAFNDLVADITTKDITVPWRASMRLESGGVQSQALKRMYLGIFTWASPTVNRRIKEALEANVEIDGSTDNITRFRMSFSTWVPAGQDERLRKNAQIVMGAVKRWGNSGVDGISGDPMATTLSTMPGLTQASTAPVAAAPLRDALAMLPLARQGSPWEAGSMLFRTASGKPWPFQPGSAEQTTWITLIVGTPGSGKSVFMNAMNFASAIALNAAAGDDPVLPRISILDIGTSSAGVVSLLQESLPAHRRHEVLFSKLRNDRDHSINIFDTQLGMRKPMAADRQFLINFLGLLMSDGATPPSRAMQGLISATIDGAYEMLMDHRHPKAYLRNEAPIVDAMLDELGFEQTPETVWWEVVDFLFQEGKFTEAEIAQRHAVPTISDLVTASQADQVRMPYAGVSDAGSGQDVISAFQRVISEVVRDYPIMSSFTRFSIGSARVVALDLMDVTARGSGQNAQKQTGVMYMLARQVTTRDFFVDPEEIKQLVRRGDLPDFYAKHHIKAAKQMGIHAQDFGDG